MTKPYTQRTNITTGVSDRMMIKMKYTTFIDLGAVPAPRWFFRGNSINDPDQTGVGGQPTGHDEWSNFYNRYCVYSSKINVEYCNANSATTGNVLCNVVPLDDTASRTYDELATYPYARTKTLVPISGGGNPVRLNNYMGTKKLFATNILDDLYKAGFNSNPTRQFYWCVAADSMDGVTNVNINAKVTITYYVMLYDRKNLLAS